MATQPSKEQGNLTHVEPPTDIESVYARAGSASSRCGGALEDSKEEVDEPYYQPLLRAAFRGDWESATRFFERDAASKMAKITSRSETLLHIAALSAHDQFLENLVGLLSPNPVALEMVDCDGRTALHNAVLCGRIRMVKALVRSNPKLTQLADTKGRVPLGISAQEASTHKDIAWFLAKNTTNDGPGHPFSSPSAIDTIIHLTFAGHLDITLYLVGQYPHLLTTKSTNRDEGSILGALARSGSHFRSGTRLNVLEALIYKCIPVDLNYKPTDKNSDPALQSLTRSLWNTAKTAVPIIKRIHEVKLRHVTSVELTKQICIAISDMNTIKIADFFQESDVFVEAINGGICDLVKLCIQFFPELWTSLYDGSMRVHAVNRRQERIVGLLLQVSSTNELSLVPGPTTQESNNMMYTVIQYEPAQYYSNFNAVTSVAGAAFQLQRELQWYKAVESWVVPNRRNCYFKGKRSWTIFVEKRKDLLESGEKWVKDTSNSCMLVSTLIATVLFAAAFTVPGGNDDKTGVPLLLGEDSFRVFVISDVLGLFSSVTAILLFLAILTSRYEPQDFLEALPKKIIMGLSFLLLSLAVMLVAFAATLTMVLDKRSEWLLIPIFLLTTVPVVLFILLQLPLLYQMAKSTYGPSIFRPDGIWE